MVQYVCSVVYNHHSAVHGVFGIEKVVSEAYLPLRHKYRIVAWGTISKSFLTHSAPGTCNMHFSSHSSSTARQFSTSLIGQVARATLSDHRRRKKSRKNLPLFSQACTCRPAHTTYVRYSILFKWSHERKEQTNCFHEVRLTGQTWSWKVPIYPSPRYTDFPEYVPGAYKKKVRLTPCDTEIKKLSDTEIIHNGLLLDFGLSAKVE